MNIDTAFPSKYLKAADCEAGDITLTIQDVRIEEIGPEKDSKPVVFFKERDQGWVLNKTNKNILVDAFGLQTDNWIGKRIELYSAKTFMGAKEVDCLRVRISALDDGIPI